MTATSERFAVVASVHGWRWTYTGITAGEAQETADVLSAGSGETWTVHTLRGPECSHSGQKCPGRAGDCLCSCFPCRERWAGYAAWEARRETCRDCGRQVEREDTPMPGAAWAPVPWWHHMGEAQARACPGRGPVQPAAVTAGGGQR